jgi:hypothetical protein
MTEAPQSGVSAYGKPPRTETSDRRRLARACERLQRRHRPGVGAHVEAAEQAAGVPDRTDRVDLAGRGALEQPEHAGRSLAHVDVRIGPVPGRDVDELRHLRVEVRVQVEARRNRRLADQVANDPDEIEIGREPRPRDRRTVQGEIRRVPARAGEAGRQLVAQRLEHCVLDRAARVRRSAAEHANFPVGTRCRELGNCSQLGRGSTGKPERGLAFRPFPGLERRATGGDRTERVAFEPQPENGKFLFHYRTLCPGLD